MNSTLPSVVLMIKPANFGFNSGTASSNAFQQNISGIDTEDIKSLALEEFDNFVSLLKAWDIEVLVFEDSPYPIKTDAIFPNNWFSTHENGWLISYPMMSPARRTENRDDIINALEARYGFIHRSDLRTLEQQNHFLEGTGSLVLDRRNKLAYAAISPRTSPTALKEWAKLTGYQIIAFNSIGPDGNAIYHTNVMMCIGDNFAIIAADTIPISEQKRIKESLQNSGKELLYLSNEQAFDNFAGNMLALENRSGERLLIMSASAKRCLSAAQLSLISDWGLHIVAVPLSIIETIGGGSARCMLAEIVPPQ